MPPETIALAPARAKRLPRFTRASQERVHAFRLTDRDREILRLLYEHRFLTAAMIDDLVHPVAPTPGQEALVRRLRERPQHSTAGDNASESPQGRARRVI